MLPNSDSMRYGKIYFYDRLGNKVQNETSLQVKEKEIDFKNPLELPNKRKNMTRNRGNYAQLSPPFAAVSSGYVPNDPFFKEDIFGIESPPVRMPEELKEDFAYGLERKILDTPPEGETKTFLPGDILSPLNDLKASPEARDEERYKVIKELEKLDLDDRTDRYNKDTRTRDFANTDDIIGEDEERISYRIKHSQSTPDIQQIYKRRNIDEEGELCEHCLLEEHKKSAIRSEALLKDKLDEHIHLINQRRSKSLKRKPELLPMNVLPPFMNRDDDGDRLRLNQQKAAYRVQLEEEMTRKRLADELEKAREKKMHNYANTEDAREYARIRDEQQKYQDDQKLRNRDILEKQIEIKRLTKNKSEDELEWWEKKPLQGHKMIERDAKFLSDQLRRNETLKNNLLQLEKFKADLKDEDLAKQSANKQYYDSLRIKIGEQSELIRDKDLYEKPRRFVYDPNPSVYKAWEDAHMVNDKRYRILQDLELQQKRQQEIQDESRCIRCRRCHRLIRRELKRKIIDEIHRR